MASWLLFQPVGPAVPCRVREAAAGHRAGKDWLSPYVTDGYYRQQLIVTSADATVIGMANVQLREEFSKRLRKALQDRGLGVDSPTRLAQTFNGDYPDRRVTPQAVRKWLNGEAIPSDDKLRALAEWLGITPYLLRYGMAEGGKGAQESAAPYRVLADQELVRRYRKLNPRQQHAVAEIITALAAKDRRR
jgi:transcriptional regulator with XRE-family HTH domain